MVYQNIQKNLENVIRDLETQLDNEMVKLERKKHPKIDKKDKKDKKDKPSKGAPCIFRKCPPGAKGVDSFLYNTINLKDGYICYFKECPTGSTNIGNFGKKGDLDVCEFKSCPKGAKALKKSYLALA